MERMNMPNAYQPIPYSDAWDKLKDARHTTIRNQFSYRPGLPPLDKSISYYNTGKLYTEVLKDKPLHLVRLYGLEINVNGKYIPEQLLLKDVAIDGKPSMEWYKKIRAMPHCLILHLEVVSKPEAKP